MRKTTLAAICSPVFGLLIGTTYRPASAQNGGNPASIGPGTPLPVFVTNDFTLPTGFGPGSNWRFTTWTSPSQIDWVGHIERVSGPWAYIRVTMNGNTTGRWYYVPAMPGSWEQQ